MVQIRESDSENNFGLFLLFLNISVLLWKLPVVFVLTILVVPNQLFFERQVIRRTTYSIKLDEFLPPSYVHRHI
jgi:hypothetical protein